jgi:hypothetical protein
LVPTEAADPASGSSALSSIRHETVIGAIFGSLTSTFYPG